MTIRITDNGGVLNGGDDASATQSFTITVTAVNDAPSFIKGADVAAPEDAGQQTVIGWATAIAAGPSDEAGQTVAFAVTGNTNTGLFATQPAISAVGTLTFKAAFNQSGAATITVELRDDGGTANGGDDISSTQSFVITISGANDPPLAGNDPITVRLGGPVALGLGQPGALNILANDSGGAGEPGDQPLITSYTGGSRGIIAITGGGTGLTYDPVGCTTGTDDFQYTITDGGGLTASATVACDHRGSGRLPGRGRPPAVLRLGYHDGHHRPREDELVRRHERHHDQELRACPEHQRGRVRHGHLVHHRNVVHAEPVDLTDHLPVPRQGDGQEEPLRLRLRANVQGQPHPGQQLGHRLLDRLDHGEATASTQAAP